MLNANIFFERSVALWRWESKSINFFGQMSSCAVRYDVIIPMGLTALSIVGSYPRFSFIVMPVMQRQGKEKSHAFTLFMSRSCGGSFKRIVAFPFSTNFEKTCWRFSLIYCESITLLKITWNTRFRLNQRCTNLVSCSIFLFRSANQKKHGLLSCTSSNLGRFFAPDC